MVSTRRLREMPFFKDFSQEELVHISTLMKEVFFAKGAVVWEEGSPGQGLHIIDFGKVRVTKRTKENAKQTFAVLKQNNFFGELSLLDGRSHSATVEAAEDTKVLVLQRTDMEKLLEESPRTAYKIVREMTIAICEILRDMNNKYMNLADYIWE